MAVDASKIYDHTDKITGYILHDIQDSLGNIFCVMIILACLNIDQELSPSIMLLDVQLFYSLLINIICATF